MAHPKNFIDMTGQRFGKLIVNKQVINPKYTSAYWECKCDCGVVKVIYGKSLRKGVTKSCGCIMRQTQKTHGMSDTKIYGIWEGIKARCLNPHRKEYKNYGGRGIKLCESWHSFKNFYEDMGEPPEKFVIDRTDNDGDYEPNNCKWVSYKESNNNARFNAPLTINGVTKNITSWCEHFGVNKNTGFVRIFRGWDPEKAVSHKPKKRHEKPHS